MLPAFPYQIPGPLRLADYLAKALVFLVFAGGCAYRILGWAMGRGRKLLSAAQPVSELVLAAAIAVFIYAALVVCAADMGKPGQRAPVLFIIPVVLPLILSQRKRKIRGLNRIPTPPAGAELTVEK